MEAPVNPTTPTAPPAHERRGRRTLRRLAAAALVVLAAASLSYGPQAATAGTPATAAPAATTAGGGYLPRAKHVFVINLENKGYDETWGPASAAPYLSQTLRSQGVLLNQYFGTAHNSQPNYVAQISGQGPNPRCRQTAKATHRSSAAAPPAQARQSGTAASSRPASPTVAGQLKDAGKTWKGYMEDMGTPCRHPRWAPLTTPRRPRSATSTRRGTTRLCTSPASPIPGLRQQRRRPVRPKDGSRLNRHDAKPVDDHTESLP